MPLSVENPTIGSDTSVDKSHNPTVGLKANNLPCTLAIVVAGYPGACIGRKA